MERYKRRLYAGTIRSQSGVLGLGNRLAAYEIFAGDPGIEEAAQQRFLSITPAQALAAAREWITDGAYVLEARPVPKFKVSGEVVDRKVKPPVGTMANFNLPPLQRATLSNGVTIALAERHDLPTVAMTMYFDGGALPDRNPASVGLSDGFALTTTGTRTRSRTDISTALERSGASIYWTVAQEEARFTLDTLKSNLDETLDLYADILINPTFPEEEWMRSRERFVKNYADNSVSAQGKLARLVPRYLVGADHPYA